MPSFRTKNDAPTDPTARRDSATAKSRSSEQKALDARREERESGHRVEQLAHVWRAEAMPASPDSDPRALTPLGDRLKSVVAFVEANRASVLRGLSARREDAVVRKRVAGIGVVFYDNGKVFVDMGPEAGWLGRGTVKQATKGIDYDEMGVAAMLRLAPTRRGLSGKAEKWFRNKFHGENRRVGEEIARFKALAGRDGIPKFLGGGSTWSGENLYTAELTRGALESQAMRLRSRAAKLDFAIGALSGLRSMHDQGLVHGDLNAGNVLVGQDGRGLLGDFGQSKPLPAGHRRFGSELMALGSRFWEAMTADQVKASKNTVRGDGRGLSTAQIATMKARVAEAAGARPEDSVYLDMMFRNTTGSTLTAGDFLARLKAIRSELDD